MNVVLYTVDFEPITVLDLPFWLIEQMERQGSIRIALQEPPRHTDDSTPVVDISGKTVTISCYRLRWRDGTTKTVLVTPDEELALMLKPEWLAGQRGQINTYKTTIFQLTESLYKALHKKG